MLSKTGPGFAFPYGLYETSKGANFNLYAPYADKIILHLFDNKRVLIKSYELSPLKNKTGDIWHIEIYSYPDTFLYAWEVLNGDRFPTISEKLPSLILDPFAKQIDSTHRWNDRSLTYQPLAKFSKDKGFDWEEVCSPNIPLKDLIIYEMHVRGFTQDLSSEVSHKGTFLGLIEKLPHLVDLGVNAIELLPIHEFNEKEYSKINPKTKEILCNYWGYSSVNFFTPNNRYAVNDSNLELKKLVKACHEFGIEVILDVVFNHSAEGAFNGPNYNYKCLDPEMYHRTPNNEWENFSGCGNTLNAQHPYVKELILQSLRHFVEEYRIDGFRFDLASIFYRGDGNQFVANPRILEAISKDPILINTKLIAEPWDAGGLYQVGSFYPESNRWSEWNGQYRDAVRSFIKGDIGTKGIFATRIMGSQDIYHQKAPQKSINFVTCHDGFSLKDLVSYNQKHNLANGEENRDGSNDNISWNCGFEGPTDEKEIRQLRKRQKKNFILTLLISQGIPLIHQGDEYGHTKLGNNNTWCQDSELSWFLWDDLEANSEIYTFMKGMIEIRRSSNHFTKEQFLTEDDITWFGTTTDKPQWNLENHFVAFILKDHQDPYDYYIAFNSGNKKVNITLPKTKHIWQWRANTSAKPPLDIYTDSSGPLLITNTYTLPPYSSIILKETPKVND